MAATGAKPEAGTRMPATANRPPVAGGRRPALLDGRRHIGLTWPPPMPRSGAALLPESIAMSSKELGRAAAGVAVAAALAAGGCALGRPPAASPAARTATAVLESFLGAANCVATPGCPDQARSLETMGLLFGTRDGPLLARDSRPAVERRMYALAALLRCDTFAVGGESVVPGRVGDAVRLEATVRQRAREAALPVTMVRMKAGPWLVESLEVAGLP